jgi:adenylate cyclase
MGGRIANTAGDSVLAEFPRVVEAVQAAVEVQEALRTANEPLPEHRRVCFRIGVHVGDVMVKAGDLFGEGVNIAARLQGFAEPGAVCISGDVHRHIRKTLSLAFVDLGVQQLKNITEPVQAYRIDVRATRRAPERAEEPADKGIGEANCCGAPVREPERRRCREPLQ